MVIKFRIKLVYIFLFISSCFNGFAKRINPTMVVDSLSVPGWFIVHQNLIRQRKIKGKIIGMAWDSYTMPDEWCFDMMRMAGKVKHDRPRKK